jgi:hypothetical protein
MSARKRLDEKAQIMEIILPIKKVEAGPKSLTPTASTAIYKGG